MAVSSATVIKMLMAIEGVKVKTLAEKTRIPATTLSTIINGKMYPSPRVRKLIADNLGVSIDLLFFDNGWPRLVEEVKGVRSIDELKAQVQ